MNPYSATYLWWVVLLLSPLSFGAALTVMEQHQPLAKPTFFKVSHLPSYVRPCRRILRGRQREQLILSWLPTSPGSPLQDFSESFSSSSKISPENTKQNSQKNKNETRLSEDRHNASTVPSSGKNTSSAFNITNTFNTTKAHRSTNLGSGVLFGQTQNTARWHSNSTKNSNMTLSNQTSNKSYYSSLMETYFPFLQASTPPNAPLRLPVSTGVSTSSKKKYNSSPPYTNAMSVLQGKSPNETITVSDMQMILSSIQSTSPPTYSSSSTPSSSGPGVAMRSSAVNGETLRAVGNTKGSSAQVAFPQPSILSYRDVQRGTTFAGGLIGMVLGTTVLPNLWLIGMLFGSLYGFEITKPPLEGQTAAEQPEKNLVARYLIQAGRLLAVKFLQVYDNWKTLWFLYKTGQLSYEYYKRYEMLDQRFAIQNKVDAWNARFVEGKKRFDQWEQDNEIGRTVLAGLRTVWLVDEQSKRRTRQKSRYRVVQLLYDAKFYVQRWLKKAQYRVKTFFQEGGVQSFLIELRSDLSEGGSKGARLAAVLVAVATVNIFGALFSISPGFSNFLAVLFAVIWPSWALNTLMRVRNQSAEISSRAAAGQRADSTKPLMASSFNAPDFMRRYDRNLFHYYTRSDGTKKYYRTGQSMASSNLRAKTAKRNTASKQGFNPFVRPSLQTAKAKPGDGWFGMLRKNAT